MVRFQIFAGLQQAEAINDNINAFLGFPNGSLRYRGNMVHFNVNDSRVACVVKDVLIALFVGMTAEQKLLYYDEDDLVNVEYLATEKWFTNEPDPIPEA